MHHNRLCFAARILPPLLILGGMALLVNGLEAPLNAAVTCVQGVWIQPAECTEAHVAPAPNDRVGGTEGGCGFDNGPCGAVSDACSSTPKFNNARKGVCQAYIGGCDIYQCSEDFFKTAVTLSKVIGGCDSVNGDCACRYSAAMPVETLNVEVCNCKQEKL